MNPMPALWNDLVTWNELEARFRQVDVRRVQMKFLTRNHNSKNQIAGLGNDLSALGHLFLGPVSAHAVSSGKPKAGPPIYRTAVPWVWLTEEGLSPAPETKLIYYPQYPEIRLSGFLEASLHAPTELLAYSPAPDNRSQEPGRVLVFGPGKDRRVFAAIVSMYSPASRFLEPFNGKKGQLVELALSSETNSSKQELFDRLWNIHGKGWIPPYRLHMDGSKTTCLGTNCHGVTLESELGISSNGVAGPDFLDWEVKGHKVAHLEAHLSSRITLLTPNPDAGLAKDRGTTWLVGKYGLTNPDGLRMDLSGVHVAGNTHPKTGLRFGIEGFDPDSKKITDDGYLYWIHDATDELIGAWSFTKLLTHWQNKHSKAVFVPCIANSEQPAHFSYGTRVHVGEGTSFLRFLSAVSDGTVVLDPGLNAKRDTAGNWKGKTRFQFRASLNSADSLYTRFSKETITGSPV